MRLEADTLDASLWFAWSCGWLFILGYSLLTPWWERRPGWVASLHGLADLCFTTPFVLHFIWHRVGEQPWFDWYFAGSFFLAGLVELARLWMIWREIRARRVRSRP